MDVEILCMEKEDLISELQSIHYQLKDSTFIDNYTLDRVVIQIEEVLERFDALDY